MRSLLNPVLLALALGHFVVDLNANLLPVMLPFLRASLELSYAQTGLIITCYSATSSMAQPLFGYLSDRIGGRKLLVLPVVWMVVFMGAAGNAPTYLSLVALVTMAGLGSAAYHPQGAATARRLAGRNVATAVSIFSLGGIAGFSLGPMVGAAAFTALGLRGTAAFVPAGLLVAVLITFALAGLERPTQHQTTRLHGVERPSVPVMTLLSLLFVVVMRAWVEYGTVAYTPLRFAGELTYSSRLLFAFLFGEALGTFVGAVAADRLGRRRVIIVTSLLLAPAMHLYNTQQGPPLFGVAVVAGLLLGSSVPVTIVMAQELLPRNVGVASGLMMGFAFGMGGLGVALNGVIADHYGLAASLLLLAALPLLGAVVTASFPSSVEARERLAPEPARPSAGG